MTDLRHVSPKSALVLGATGAVGHVLLREVLLSKRFSRVGECGRRVTEEKKLPTEPKIRRKLEQRVVDFDRISEAQLGSGNWDVVFIALGGTLSGSHEEFEKVDKEYVVNAARAAKSDGHKQTLVYISSAGASPTSDKFYFKSKGQTEKELAEVGFDDLIVFRPGFLTGAHREHVRFSELALRPILGFASAFSSSISIPVHTLAKSMQLAGELGSAGLRAEDKATEAWEGSSFTVVNNAAARRVCERVYM